MAEVKKICKGCNSSVARPVVCMDCNVVSHPACIGRTGHPFSDGKFIPCAGLSGASVSTVNRASDFENRILALVRTEFDKFHHDLTCFKKEMRELYLEDITRMQQTVQALTDRVDSMERSMSSGAQPVMEEEILEELVDRKRRAKNVMIYNLDESDSADNSVSDQNRVKNLIRDIKDVNLDGVRIARLGAKRHGSIRPIKVIMRCKEDALLLIKNRLSCPSPIRIEQDRTLKQRRYLHELKDRLKVLHDSGHMEKTIRYVNGIPKIVDTLRSQASKN